MSCKSVNLGMLNFIKGENYTFFKKTLGMSLPEDDGRWNTEFDERFLDVVV